MRRASASLLASTIRPIAAIALPRTGAGMSPHAGWAALAAAHAAAMVAGLARLTCATTSVSRDGLVELNEPDGASSAARPLTTETNVFAIAISPCSLVPVQAVSRALRQMLR